MANASEHYAIRQLPVVPNSWTPVVVPINCFSFSVRCDQGAIYICTDQADASTQDTLPQGAQECVDAVWGGGGGCRFEVGSTVAYLKSAGGNLTAILKFVF
ncbi:MAG TPA: hypothetical protein VND65_18290 [Candidatus Binatia bacterium]|nr:hypothetical protein [Candidatus Binatia bacterium]